MEIFHGVKQSEPSGQHPAWFSRNCLHLDPRLSQTEQDSLSGKPWRARTKLDRSFQELFISTLSCQFLCTEYTQFADLTWRCTGIPRFSESLHYTISLLQVLFLLTKINPKRICFYEKKEISKNSVHHLCCTELFQGSINPQQWEWRHQAPCLGIKFSNSASSCPALNCVCDLCCISIILCIHSQDVSLRYQKRLRLFFGSGNIQNFFHIN